MYSPAALSEVLLRRQVATEDLTPFLEEFLRQDPSVPTEPVIGPPPAPEPQTQVRGIGSFVDLFRTGAEVVGSFADPSWYMYGRVWGVRYNRRGRFEGRPPQVEVRGPRDYVYRPDKDDPFRFVRTTGETHTPGTMVTDGGSVPRVCWAVPGLDPWSFLPAFLVHDWSFLQHHCVPGHAESFADANDVLGEAVFTMMCDAPAVQDWRTLAAIHVAVSSFVGRKVWSKAWTPDQCASCLDLS